MSARRRHHDALAGAVALVVDARGSACLRAVVQGRNVPRLEQHSLSGVHCEQASPKPSPSESFWSGL